MSTFIDTNESKGIFDQLSNEDIIRIITVLQGGVKRQNLNISYTPSISGCNAKYSIQFYNKMLRSVTIEIDSNLMISYLGERGESSTGGNSYFAYKELCQIIAEKSL